MHQDGGAQAATRTSATRTNELTGNCFAFPERIACLKRLRNDLATESIGGHQTTAEYHNTNDNGRKITENRQ